MAIKLKATEAQDNIQQKEFYIYHVEGRDYNSVWVTGDKYHLSRTKARARTENIEDVVITYLGQWKTTREQINEIKENFINELIIKPGKTKARPHKVGRPAKKDDNFESNQ